MKNKDDFIIVFSIEVLIVFLSFFLIFTACLSKKSISKYTMHGVVSEIKYEEDYVSNMDKALKRKTKAKYKYSGLLTKENNETVNCTFISGSVPKEETIKVLYSEDFNPGDQVIPRIKVWIDVCKYSFYITFATALLLSGICVYKRKSYPKLLIVGTAVVLIASLVVEFIRL